MKIERQHKKQSESIRTLFKDLPLHPNKLFMWETQGINQNFVVFYYVNKNRNVFRISHDKNKPEQNKIEAQNNTHIESWEHLKEVVDTSITITLP